MEYLSELGAALVHNWAIWLVTVTLIVAAVSGGALCGRNTVM